MKITWKPRSDATGSVLVLGDNTRSARGPGSKLIISCRPSYQSQVQVAAYPDSEIVETFGRDNLQTTLAVAVLYEFRSFGECTKFTFDLANYIRQEGILEVAHLGGGAAVMQGVCSGAEVAAQDGCTALVNYTFTGGKFTKGQNPTSVGVASP